MNYNAKYDWTNKEKFLDDLRLSTCMSDFLVKQSLSPSSGNFYTFKKWIFIHKIDLANFNYTKSKPYLPPLKIKSVSFEKIFCENSIVSKQQLRNKIIKEKLIPYKCSCGLEGVWQDKPITLQLEHKNGINNDNRLDNLEYLCPNCHSQTLTYGAKNRHLKAFEKRIKLLKDVKEISLHNLSDISKDIKISPTTFHGWCIQYKDKLEKEGIKVQLVKCTKPVKVSDIKSLIDDVKLSCLSNKAIEEIASKHNTKSQFVRKIIKNNDLDLYLKLDLSNLDKKKILSKKIQEDRKNFLNSIDRENPNVQDILSYFSLDYSRTMAWLGKYDKELLKTIKNTQIIKEIKKSKIKQDRMIIRRKNLPKIAVSKQLQADRKIFLSSIDRENPNIQDIVSYFNLDYSRTMAWLGKYDKDLFKIIKAKQKNHIPISNLEIDSVASRLEALCLLTNKKQVPALAIQWNISASGAKKWIKNNAPEKFIEIYDDKHLEKNKVKALKLEKMNYIKNLKIENFNLEDFIRDYGGNKSGSYSILSKYNPVLFEHLSKTPDCVCGGKMRTAGTSNKKVVYKCKTCGKSFTSSIV